MKKKTIALFAVPAFILASTVGITQVANASGFSGDCERSEHRGKKHHDGKRLERLAKKLDLSDVQQTQMKALFEQQKASREGKSDERKAIHQALRDLDVNAADFDTKLAAVKEKAKLQAVSRIDSKVFMKQKMSEILTAEQLVKLQEMQDKRSKHKDRS